VGEVDDLHEPEDQREPGRDQGVNEPHEHAADERLGDQLERQLTLTG
jgi:hypothetical protein